MSKTENQMDEQVVAFILTHGRPDNVSTDKALRRCGYTGPIYYIVDNEDKSIDKYRERYGNSVIVFDKKAIADQHDEGDNFDDRRTTMHVRNAMFEIAKKLGIRYFIQFDDDYCSFQYKTNQNEQFLGSGPCVIYSLDAVLNSLLKFYKSINCKSIAMAQGGDFIGGIESGGASQTLSRKCMNTFICSTENPFSFFGRLNEDVNTYITRGSRGELFFTTKLVMIVQKQTQTTASGMSDTYLQYGTYVKSFYTVMYHPSSVKVSYLKWKCSRIHHRVNWKTSVPVIIRESHVKRAT